MYELALLAIPVVIVVYLLKKDRTPGNIPPGPPQSLILGNYKDVNTNCIHQSLHTLSQTYGPLFSLRLVSKRVIVFNNADVIRKAFQSETYKDVFNDKPRGFYGTYLVYGHQDVLFGPYNDATFKVKSLMLKGLEPLQSEEHIQAEVDELIQGLVDTSGTDCDPRTIAETLIANIHAKILTGKVLPDDSRLIWDFASSSNRLLQPSVEATLKLLPVLRHFDFNLGHHYKTALGHRDRMLRRFIEDQRATFTPEVSRGLVDVCFCIQRNEKNPDGQSWLTDDMIRALVVDVIGAGVVATTNSFLALLLCLANSPECQRKMQSELDKVIGNTRRPNGNDVTNLPYCHAVLLESFRYNSLIPIINHCCSARDVEFEGYCIPKGSVLFGCFWSAHHDESLWIDPWNFRPERFLDDEGRLLPIDHQFRRSLFPYGLGSRICTGKSLAQSRLLVYITAVVQHFDILPPSGTDLLPSDPKLYKIGPVLQIPDFQCRIVPRSEHHLYNNKQIVVENGC